jgi:hypothetical protein
MFRLPLPRLNQPTYLIKSYHDPMRPSYRRSLLTLVTTAGLLLGAVTAADARPIKFPKEEPTFKVTLPEKWTSKTDKDGNLDCDPEDESGFNFSIVLLEGVSKKAELKKLLPTVAKKMAEGAKIKNLELGDIDETKNEHGVPFTGIRADGKSEGIAFVIVLQAFEPQKGKFYTIMTVSPKKADEKHEEDYNSIYDSIEPLE